MPGKDAGLLIPDRETDAEATLAEGRAMVSPNQMVAEGAFTE